jgi:3-hydroxy-9,10-secoandrosta-1,3,5(10)-triene-9,17-dione monooxygenase reductase component
VTAAGAPGAGPSDERTPSTIHEPPLPVDVARFREVLGHFATGVTVVTAMEQGEPVGFTCQAFTSLSLEPPLVALAPGKSSTSWPRIRMAGRFGVNILADDQEALCREFAVSGGDKFVAVDWGPGRNGAPRLTGSLAWVECDLVLIHDAGDHELVIGQVTALDVDHGRSPLVYYRGGFGRIVP